MQKNQTGQRQLEKNQVIGFVNVFRQDMLLSILMEKIMNQLLCEAIIQEKCVKLEYEGHTRVVEVHLVGTNTEDKTELALVWQVSGGSNSGLHEGWKTLHIDKISSPTIISQDSKAPREGYVQQGSQYTGIVYPIECQV